MLQASMVSTPLNIKIPQNDAAQHIKAGNQALQKGLTGQALAHFIQAVKKAPENHRFKIHLCEFLKNVSFPNHEADIQQVILDLLQTDGLDHQCLWQAWLSLLIKDPDMDAFHDLMTGQKPDIITLEKSLDNPYLIVGLEKLFCVDMGFENALKKIKNLIDNKKIKSKEFSKAFDIYNHRTENLLSDTAEFELDYEIDASIPSLGKIKDQTSQDVQNQYEASPYPRWTSYHLLPPPAQPQKEPYNHLIAGCGTGFSSCMTAMLYPHAQITAIDLSRASLTYATQKARELKLDNIDFYQADILDLSALDKEFEIIECSGVLHHMKDPLEGWRCLIEKLAPNGKMHIGLYSELGRADVVAARQLIADEAFEATPTGIRAARQAIANLPEDHPAKQVLSRRDFYNLSGCRDLIFHVQEHRFTIAQIETALKELGLKLDLFNLDNMAVKKQYTAAFPDDRTMVNLKNWHQFEQGNPSLFRGMYQFWCSPTQKSS